jgi:hypothetical protein
VASMRSHGLAVEWQPDWQPKPADFPARRGALRRSFTRRCWFLGGSVRTHNAGVEGFGDEPRLSRDATICRPLRLFGYHISRSLPVDR